MISHVCIRRPIFASVLSIVITIAGLAAMVNLPTAQYSEITPPQVTVSAAYAGAGRLGFEYNGMVLRITSAT